MRRIAGTDRFDTAARVSRGLFPGTRRIVHVATGRDFPDALAATPTVVASGGPLLLVDRDRIPDVVGDDLRRLSPDEIVVLGGPAAVSRDVELALQAFAPTVRRLAGPDRYATAVATVPEDRSPTTAMVATGEDFPDGLAAGAAAARLDAAVLLSRRDDVPDATWEWLRGSTVERILLVGGEGALSADVERRLGALIAPPPDEELETEPAPSEEPTEDGLLPGSGTTGA